MRQTKLFYILVFLFFALFIEAQSYAQANRFGFNASILYSDWEGEKIIDDDINYSGKIGYNFGVYSVKEFSPNWNLSYGLNVTLKGFDMNGQLIIPGVAIAADVSNHSVYIDAPITMRYIFGNDGPTGFFVVGGLQFSYLVYNRIDGFVQYNGVNYYGDPENNAAELNRFDMAIFPSIGYQFLNGIHFQLIYERGLINIVKDDDYLGATKAFNSLIKFQIGLDL